MLNILKTVNFKQSFKQTISLQLSLLLIFSPLSAADITVDGTTNTTLDKSRNDITIVNIANPNSKGLSHNKYKEYNVNKKGLILNNSTLDAQNTQLSGYIQGNTNLTTNAKVILNEVTSTNRSFLNGYTEIAGKKADLVIANPNGITINGAGFINTSNLTLTTGKSNIVNGRLNSFSILKGDITVEGDGLNDSSDAIYLYTRALKLNAAINAKNLNIVLGNNEIDYITRQITATNEDEVENLLLDSSTLGGMYANRITLVGTNKGLGVNLPPEVLASQGEIIITNDGNISLSSLSSTNDIKVTSNEDIIITNNVTSKENISLNSNNLTNSGVVQADKKFTIDTLATISNSGTLKALDNLTLKTNILKNDKDILSSKTLDVTAITITNTDSTMQGTDVIVSSDDTTLNNSDVLAVNSITIDSTNTLITSGTIQGNESVDINTKTLINEKEIISNDITITSTDITNSNDAKITSSNNLNITGTNSITNKGIIQSKKELDISTKALITSNLIIANEKLNINATDSLNNSGEIHSNANSTITSSVITNTKDISANEILNITSKSLVSSAGNINANDILINSDTLSIENSKLISNNMNLQITNKLINKGQIEAKEDFIVITDIFENYSSLLANVITLNVQNFKNKILGTIESSGVLNLIGTTLVNENIIKSTKDMSLTISGELTNSKKIESLATLNISANSLSNIDSDIISSQDSTISVTNTLDNTNGLVKSNNNLTLNVKHLNNTNAEVTAINDLSLTSDDIILTNSKIYASNNATLGLTELNNISTSSIEAGNDLTINATNYLTNNSNLLANAALTITTNGALVNNALLSSQRSMNINAASLSNTSTISAGSGASNINIAGDILNSSRISSSENLNVSGNNIINNGFFNSANNLTISSSNLTNNTTLFAGNNMNLYTANTLLNNENANIFALNNMLFAKDATVAANGDRTKTQNIKNDRANIETLDGNIEIWAKNFTNDNVINDEKSSRFETLIDEVYERVEIKCADPEQGCSNVDGTTWSQVPLVIQGTNGLGSTNFEELKEKYKYTVYNVFKRGEIDPTSKYVYPEYYLMKKDGNKYNPHKFIDFRINLKKEIEYLTNEPNLEKGGQLNSGNNLTLAVDNIYNNFSVISANGNLNFKDVNTLTNKEVELDVTIHDKTDGLYWHYSGGRSWIAFDGSIVQAVSQKIATSKFGSTIQVQGNIEGNINGSLVNGTAHNIKKGTTNIVDKTGDTTTSSSTKNEEASSLSSIEESNSSLKGMVVINEDKTISTVDIKLPTNDYGLFITAKDPNSKFLIESNPEFTIKANFISSDYLMEHLNFSADITTKKVGDAFYENRLIRESILKQTGKRYLNPDITSDNDQFKYLMDNSLKAQEELELSAGISLTKAQIDALTQDIVWMEEKIVSGHKVLVPTVYIANLDEIKVSGAQIIAGKSINLEVDTLENSGTITANNNLTIDAKDEIINDGGDITAGKELKFIALNDIKNISGRIKAEDVSVTSTQGSIINETRTQVNAFGDSENGHTFTNIGRTATIEGTNTLKLDAKEEIFIKGADVSGGEVTFDANRVNITTIVDEKAFNSGNSKNYIKTNSRTHTASNVNANNLTINTKAATTIEGSNLKTKNNLTVNAATLNILSVANEDYRKSKRSKKKGFNKSSTTITDYSLTNEGSKLSSGGKISLNTKEDITIVSSTLEGDGGISAKSEEGSVNVLALEDILIHDVKKEKTKISFKVSKDGASFFKKTTDTLRTEDYKSQGTLLSSNKSLEVAAKEDVNMQNVDMKAKEDIALSATNVNIINTDDRHITKESHENIEMGVTVTDDSVSSTAEISKESMQTTSTKVNQSTVEAGGKFTVTAKNDINFVSVDVKAKDEVSLDAGNNVSILEAKDTTKTETKKESLKGEATVKVKNEYAEIAKMVLVIKKAKDSLKDTKSKYKAYKNDVKAQKVKLALLEDDFKNGKIGIEQIDIDEFKELISDLESDDEFYKAALVAATASVATKITALVAQTAKAASASGFYGFSASLELKGTAHKEQSNSSSQTSVGSNIATNNFKIKAGNKATIQGSNIEANTGEIDAKTIEVLASKDKSSSSSSSKTVEVTASIGTAGFSSVEGSVSGSKSDSSSTKYNNSNLNFKNLKLTSKEDTIIKGATIAVAETLDVDVGGDLSVESVQDVSRDSSGSISVSSTGSMSASKSQSKEKKTVLTSLSGKKVNIKVANNTNLKGALIESSQEDGVSLDTGTLTTSNLSNTKSKRNISLGGSGGSTVTANLGMGRQNSKSKTLATITSGNINVRDKENSTDIAKLNRNKDDINLELYDVKSEVKISAEVDTNMLTKKGRNKIKEDVMVSGMIADTVKQIITNDTVGVTDFFSNTDQEVKTYAGVKEAISKDPKLAALLKDPNITDAKKEQMMDKITDSVMLKLGYKDNKPNNKLVDTKTPGRDNKQVKGFHSTKTNDSYINKEYVKDNEELVKVAGTEMQRAIDNNEHKNNGTTADESKEYREERAKYSQHRGDNVVNYTNFAMDMTNQGSISNDVNTYVAPKVTKVDSVFNRSSITERNNSVFDGLDKSKGDNFGAKDFGVEHNYSTGQAAAYAKSIGKYEEGMETYTPNYTLPDVEPRDVAIAGLNLAANVSTAAAIMVPPVRIPATLIGGGIDFTLYNLKDKSLESLGRGQLPQLLPDSLKYQIPAAGINNILDTLEKTKDKE